MALEALKQFAAGQEQAINAKIESLAKSDPTERPTSDFKGQGNIKPLPDTQSVTEALQGRVAAIYKQQQENIHKEKGLRTEITKGIQAGQSTYRLLLKAMECISLMTGDTVFYSQGKDELQKLYGIFGDQEAKATEREEVQQRLTRLLEAYDREQNTDDKRRIKTAIDRHQERINELQ